MITARPQKNLTTAKQYFRQHLSQGDYHSQGQKLEGWWFGKGAERLGLDMAAPVEETAFERLCENLHPLTGDKLTVRQRRVDRRVFYDFVTSAPKSVSIMALTIGDERIVKAHSEAALAAMMQMQQVAATRVRRDGQQGIRLTGEIVAAVFRHDTSRALDPQLHTHFVIFNATWDREEQRWKALQTSEMFEAMTFYTEVYRTELARHLLELGYGLRNTVNGFEIEGVPQSVIDRFSKRRRAILAEEAKVAEKLGKPLSNNARSTLAHTSREKKNTSLSPEEVLAYQRSQLSEQEFDALRRLMTAKVAPLGSAQRISAAEAIDYAREHLFERDSVVPRHELLRVALAYARGSVVLPDLETELSKRPEFIAVDHLLTTRETLQQEQRLISLVNQGMSKFAPLYSAFSGDPNLTEEQRLALGMVLRSPDQVVGFRGGAGTGKSELLHKMVRGLEGRKPVMVLAPTAAAVEDLRQKGLSRAATVQRFLGDEQFQSDAQDRVLVVDEAGLLSTKDMLALVECAQARRCRLVLSGDTRQHSGVQAGDALRLLEQRSTLQLASVQGIVRQIDREYRSAIADLAQGKGMEGLARLEKLGAVHEVRNENRYQILAADYVASLKRGKSALIVSPTWREIERVTAEVRERLKQEGLLEQRESVLTVHDPLKWTLAQKRDLRNYQAGLILNFHKATKHFAAGEWAEVVAVESAVLRLRKLDGGLVEMTKKQAGCFEVEQKMPLPVAPGERLLIRGNRKSAGLVNGQLVTVKKVDSDGRLILAGKGSIGPDFRSFTHGYGVTSHSAQGRTVDHVYVAVDSHSILSANQNQFYVSASRGREQVQVYTDDLMFLRSAVSRSGARLSATELMERARLAPHQALDQQATPKLGLAP